jgi:hypothetical protein
VERGVAQPRQTLCAIAVAGRDLERDAAAGLMGVKMVTVNCTKELAKRLPFPLVENPQPSTNRLGPWCANSFNIGRIPMILLTNELSLLSVVIPLKGVRSFHARFLSTLEVLFHSVALSSKQIHAELEEMNDFQVTAHTNRKTLGSMNDFVFQVQVRLEQDRDGTLEQVAFDLSGIPCGPLKYGYPREAVLEILGPPPHYGT